MSEEQIRFVVSIQLLGDLSIGLKLLCRLRTQEEIEFVGRKEL